MPRQSEEGALGSQVKGSLARSISLWRIVAVALAAALAATTMAPRSVAAGQSQPQGGPPPLPDPFPTPIETNRGVVAVQFVEFATIPNGGASGSEPPRMMLLVDEPGTRRMFVNTMQGVLYSLSYDGKAVTPYVDVNDPKWGNPVDARGNERGFHSFAFHPQFAQRGRPGYGKFYTWADTSNMTPAPDAKPSGEGHTHDTVLLEWSAKDASGTIYDGDAPREMFRVADPFPNHNGGQIAFNPLTRPGAADFGLLYVGLADGGSRGPGDPYGHAQNLASAFGKILRLDPLGRNSRNGKYGIPASNPFANDGKDETLGEIYAYGMRNPQRFSWDSKTGTMYVADIGDQIVEEISPVTRGANLGWNKWEGSYRYADRSVSLDHPRSEPGLTWPVVEYDHRDPLLPFNRFAITGVFVYRGTAIRQLQHLMIFGDNPNGELFYVDADHLPEGGQSAIRRIMFNDHGVSKTLLQLIREKNAIQGKEAALRADLRIGAGTDAQVFILNKHDGIIRLLVPDRASDAGPLRRQ
jgi:glucose/arabinose dehydrogenase